MRKYSRRSAMSRLAFCTAKMLSPLAVRPRQGSTESWLVVRCLKRRRDGLPAVLHALAPHLPILVAADPAVDI